LIYYASGAYNYMADDSVYYSEYKNENKLISENF